MGKWKFSRIHYISIIYGQVKNTSGKKWTSKSKSDFASPEVLIDSLKLTGMKLLIFISSFLPSQTYKLYMTTWQIALCNNNT